MRNNNMQPNNIPVEDNNRHEETGNYNSRIRDLENCFISISQTEDDHTQTIKNKSIYNEDATINDSESCGKMFSDRPGTDVSSDISLRKNQDKNNNQINENNYSKQSITDDNISYRNGTEQMMSKIKNYDDKHEKSEVNPHLIFKKGHMSSTQLKAATQKFNKESNSIHNMKQRSASKSKDYSKKPEITPKNTKTNNIINSINSLINSKFTTGELNYAKTRKENSLNEEITFLQNELTSTRQSLFLAKKEKLNFEEENSILKLEKEKILTIKDSQIATLNERTSKYEIEMKQLNEINNFSKKRLDELTPKVWKYDELYEKYSKLCIENEKYLENNSTLNNLLLSTKKEKDEVLQKFDMHKIELDALKNDKFYLSKENFSLNEKFQNSSEKIKTLEEDLRDIRKTNQSYVEKLTEKNMKLESSYTGFYEDKLKKELEEIKTKFEIDKENLKRIYDELAERRVAYLQEEKDELKMKLIKEEKVLKEREEEREFLHTELRNLSKRTDEEISYLRIQLKIKSEDYERFSNLYEENNNLIKILKNENDSLKDKNDFLRSEMIKKESKNNEECCQYKSLNQNLREKLSSYENIENELDKVIVDSAVMSNMNNMDDNIYGNEVLSVIKDIPTSSKRRISQCLMLANKIKIMQIEIEKIRNFNQQLQKEMHIVNEEKEIFKNVAEKSKQPYQYLIKNLQDMELDNHKIKSMIEDKENTIKSLLRENEMLSEKFNSIQSDMKIILNNRQKLDTLEDIIGRFVEKDNSQIQNNTNSHSMTRSNTNNNFLLGKSNFNMKNSNMNFSNENIHNNRGSFNADSSIVIPERDMNRTNYNHGGNLNPSEVPRWYMSLKSKKFS